ncbi:DNA repair protein RecO [Dyadobacter sp. CECT 9275]|uniref:DNA repair protein RecO n=1 Tax=Dyadobacter helix TaxID=2822344 RepID=A0A916N726_9BACT|nr:DNA repair protein RecO [Dyadobacter sp. CECT 9275]CAG5012285.1 DNA repair protein RecO [Dyadobacter sp. CECT 9275]
MLHKTKGIALNYLRFRESSIIAKIYTESFGIQSYIVNGVRSSKAKGNRIALFQPLTLLDMVVYHKGKQDTVHRIAEMKCYEPFKSLPYHVTKSGISLFVTEILGKTLKEEEQNEPLFHFIEQSILYLDEAETGFENFHIQFLLHLASYLGFGIDEAEDLETELKNNYYPRLTDDMDMGVIGTLLTGQYGVPIKMDRIRRAVLLEKLIFFYKIHMESLGEIKSLDVLREVLR